MTIEEYILSCKNPFNGISIDLELRQVSAICSPDTNVYKELKYPFGDFNYDKKYSKTPFYEDYNVCNTGIRGIYIKYDNANNKILGIKFSNQNASFNYDKIPSSRMCKKKQFNDINKFTQVCNNAKIIKNFGDSILFNCNGEFSSYPEGYVNVSLNSGIKNNIIENVYYDFDKNNGVYCDDNNFTIDVDYDPIGKINDFTIKCTNNNSVKIPINNKHYILEGLFFVVKFFNNEELYIEYNPLQININNYGKKTINLKFDDIKRDLINIPSERISKIEFDIINNKIENLVATFNTSTNIIDVNLQDKNLQDIKLNLSCKNIVSEIINKNGENIIICNDGYQHYLNTGNPITLYEKCDVQGYNINILTNEINHYCNKNFNQIKYFPQINKVVFFLEDTRYIGFEVFYENSSFFKGKKTNNIKSIIISEGISYEMGDSYKYGLYKEYKYNFLKPYLTQISFKNIYNSINDTNQYHISFPELELYDVLVKYKVETNINDKIYINEENYIAWIGELPKKEYKNYFISDNENISIIKKIKKYFPNIVVDNINNNYKYEIEFMYNKSLNYITEINYIKILPNDLSIDLKIDSNKKIPNDLSIDLKIDSNKKYIYILLIILVCILVVYLNSIFTSNPKNKKSNIIL